jgi:hypothetical protein
MPSRITASLNQAKAVYQEIADVSRPERRA